MTKLCTIQRILGRAEECPESWCPFWEHGGAIIAGRCGLERLSVDLSDREIAAHLLDLRHALERARSEQDAAAAWNQLGKLVPPDLSGA